MEKLKESLRDINVIVESEIYVNPFLKIFNTIHLKLVNMMVTKGMKLLWTWK